MRKNKMKEKDYVVTSAGVKMPTIIYGTAWKKERRILYISGRIMYVIGDSPVLNSFCTGE